LDELHIGALVRNNLGILVNDSDLNHLLIRRTDHYTNERLRQEKTDRKLLGSCGWECSRNM